MAIFPRILVPYDGSPAAGRALDLARSFATETGGRPGTIVLCHAADLSAALSVTDPSSDRGSLAPIDQYRAEMQQQLDGAAEAARAAGAVVETTVVDGHPVEAVRAIAEERAVDAIVMGSHGRTGIARLVLGSTAEGVLRHASVPVVVVRDPREDPAEPSAEP